MSVPRGHSTKTCNRCGRSGSHAFRRTPDWLYECTTTTACRARARRNAGGWHDGRGRLPKQRGFSGAGPGVAYIIGDDEEERAVAHHAIREVTDLAVASGPPSKLTLSALGSRNVKLIAISAASLERIAFRNEFVLRCRQPRLGSVPVFVFGTQPALPGVLAHVPDAYPVGYEQKAADMAVLLRRQIRAFEADHGSGSGMAAVALGTVARVS